MKEQLIVKTGYESPEVSIYYDILQSQILEDSGGGASIGDSEPVIDEPM